MQNVLNILELYEKKIPTEKILPIKQNFSFLKAYHGCKIYENGNQLKEGLIPLNKNYLIKQVQYILRQNNIKFEEKILEEALETREGKIYFCLTSTELLKYANHYLIYGSESVFEVLSKLINNSKELKKILKNVGIPTYLECDIPIELIDNSVIEEIETLIQNNYDDLEWFGFSIKKPLLPKHIKKVNYPQKLYSAIDNKMFYF